MTKWSGIYLLLVLFSVYEMIYPTPAYGYLDPGTGSMILQGLAAAFFGAAFAVKMYWSKLIAFFKRNDHRK